MGFQMSSVAAVMACFGSRVSEGRRRNSWSTLWSQGDGLWDKCGPVVSRAFSQGQSVANGLTTSTCCLVTQPYHCRASEKADLNGDGRVDLVWAAGGSGPGTVSWNEQLDTVPPSFGPPRVITYTSGGINSVQCCEYARNCLRLLAHGYCRWIHRVASSLLLFYLCAVR
jgi:hypothetical protein